MNHLISNFESTFQSYKKTNLKSIAIEIGICMQEKCFSEKENSIYIAKMGNYLVFSDLHSLPRKHEYFFQVELKPEVDSRYLEIFLNSQLGHSLFEEMKKGEKLHHVLVKNLGELVIYLPDQNIQKQIVESFEKIESIQKEIETLKDSIFTDPNWLSNTGKKLSSIQNELGK